MPEVSEPPTKETPPPVTPTPAATPTPEPKAEDKRTGEDEIPFIARLYGKPKETKETKEEKKEPKEAKAGEKAVATTPEPKKKPAKVKPTPATPAAVAPQIDEERLGASIGKSIAEAQAKTPEKKSQGNTDGLSFDERENYIVLQHLEKEKRHGEAYKGFAAKYLESLPRAEQYERDWLAKHTGEEFNPDADEHKAFFDSINVLDGVSEEHWKQAEKAIITDEVTKDVEKRFDDKLKPVAAQQKLTSELPKIIESRVATARAFFGSLGDDFKAVLDDRGNINSAEIERLNKENPVRGIALSLAGNVEAFADQMHRLVRDLPPMAQKDGEPYVSPEDISGFIEQQEVYLNSLPSTPLADGGHLDEQGRRFATAEEFNAMTPDKRKHYWRLDEDKIRRMYAAEQADKAMKAMQSEESRLEQFATARGYTKATAPAKTAEQPQATKEPDPQKPTPSPAGTVEPRLAQPSSKTNGSENNTNSGWLSDLYGRK